MDRDSAAAGRNLPGEQIALLRLQISELKTKKNALSLGRKPIEAELSQLAGRVRSANTHKTRLTPEEYRQICGRQQKLKRKLAEIEVAINPLSSEIRRLCAEEDILRASCGMSISGVGEQSSGDGDLAKRLADIRDRWQQFAGDQTRVSSMRVMAAQFADDLNAVLSGRGRGAA
mgnify:FL=1